MPGLEAVLSEDSDSKFVVILAESGPAAHALDYIGHVYRSHSDSSKYQIHIVSFANDFSVLRGQPNVVLYDYLHHPFTNLGDFSKKYTESKIAAVKNILIIDDLQMFLVHSEADLGRVKLFFYTIMKQAQIVTLVKKDTVPTDCLRFIYSQADAAVTLSKELTTDQRFLCNIIKTKYSGKVIHEQSTFDVINGLVQERMSKILTSVPPKPGDALTSLTTFKLSVEDDEKASRDQLHLPYYNAQSTKPQDPDFDMFDDEDEEDEEI